MSTEQGKPKDAQRKRNRTKETVLTIAMIVVALLLIVTIILLVLLMPGRRGEGDTSSSAGNIISGQEQELITLQDPSDADSARFVLENMFPGDQERRQYVITTGEGVSAYCFGAVITQETRSLSKVMMITLISDGEPLYQGMLQEMPASLRLETEEARSTLEIALSLDTSVGNEYQDAQLALDFIWWVAEEDYDAPTAPTVEPPVVTGDGEGGGKCCPWCFGICPWCWILPILLIVLLTTLGVWLTNRRRDDEDEKTDGENAKSMTEGGE